MLNIARDSMAAVGYSPATRVFEAAGAGACLITDAWVGLDLFLDEGTEVLVARDGAEVAAHVAALTPERARAIGEAARARTLRDHTYARRGAQVDALLTARRAERTARAAAVNGAVKLVVLGLSLSSSWGNGHATTYRSLLRAFAARGHAVTFLERDVPWYGGLHRDLAEPDFCRLAFYDDLRGLDAFRDEVADADAVIVGSYVPEGRGVGRLGAGAGRRRHGLLRHRHARDGRGAGAGGLRLSRAGADPGLRPLPVLHGRADARPPRR